MAYTAPSTQPTGTLITSTMYAQLVNDLKFFHGPPTARATRVAATTLATATWVGVPFDTKDWDTNTIFSTTAPTKFFCKTAGKYLVSFTGSFSGSSLGAERIFAIQKNTTVAGTGHEYETIFETTAINGVRVALNCNGLVSLSTGQYVRAEARHDKGSNLTLSTVSGGQPRFSVLWVSS